MSGGIKRKILFVKLWPIILIVISWVFFSFPYFLNGSIPFPGDDQQYAFSPWDAYITKGPIKNPAMTDVIVQIYPWKKYTIDSLKHGIIPLWNPYSFSGTAHLGNYQTAVFSPLNVLFFILPFNIAWGFVILLQPLLAGIFMYLFLRVLKISQTGSLIGSIGFMFCGFMTVWMAWGTLDYAILVLPLTLLGIEKFLQNGKSRFVFLIFITIPFSFLSGHFQTSLYFLLFVLGYLFYKGFVTNRWYHAVIILSSIIFGFLVTLPQVLPTLQVYSQSLRSNLFKKGEVIPWEYIITFIAPDIFGNPVTRNDWFGHYAEWNGYIGLFPLMLAWYALFRKKITEIIFFPVATIISMLLAFQSPLFDLVVLMHIPVLSTSAASRIIILTGFSLLVMAGFGFDALYADMAKKKVKPTLLWLGSFILLFSILWILIITRILFPLSAVSIARQNMFLPTLMLFSIIFLVGASFILKRKQYPLYGVLGVFVFIVMVDMGRFTNKWVSFVSQGRVFAQTPITTSFHPRNPYERVLGDYGAEMAMFAGYPSVEGYDAVYMKRYGEFMHFVNTGTFGESEKSLVVIAKNSPLTWTASKLLNIAYVIHKISDGYTDWTFHFWDHEKDMQRIYKDDGFEVYKNTAAFPHVFLVGQYSIVHNPQEILSMMFNSQINLRKQLILEEDPNIQQNSNDLGNAAIISYEPNSVTISVAAKHPALLFLSDTYSPDWYATIDGLSTKVYRADYTFRSIVVPAGMHKVVFMYFPKSFSLGLFIAFLGLVGEITILSFQKKRIPVA